MTRRSGPPFGAPVMNPLSPLTSHLSLLTSYFSLLTVSSTSQHRAWCSGTTGSSAGSVVHGSNAYGQRGRKRHPEGHAAAGGTVPGIGFSRETGPESRGIDAKRPRVYGWEGWRKRA